VGVKLYLLIWIKKSLYLADLLIAAAAVVAHGGGAHGYDARCHRHLGAGTVLKTSLLESQILMQGLHMLHRPQFLHGDDHGLLLL